MIEYLANPANPNNTSLSFVCEDLAGMILLNAVAKISKE